AFWAIATTAFYGLARLGELLPTTQHDQNKVPTFRALRFEEINQHTFATIQLARTKNHNTAQRTSLIINPTYDDLCPGRWIMGNKTIFHQQAQTSLTIRGRRWPQFQGRGNNRTGHAGGPTYISPKDR
ncbi:34690_t:CDS:2, partial [Racocetra persica]